MQTVYKSTAHTCREAIAGRAAVITQPGRIETKHTLFRVPADDEVRVKLEGCGVCASNIPVWQGEPWFQYPLEPGAPGHEAWGRVQMTGPEVQGVFPGDRVAILSSHAYAEYDIC